MENVLKELVEETTFIREELDYLQTPKFTFSMMKFDDDGEAYIDYKNFIDFLLDISIRREKKTKE